MEKIILLINCPDQKGIIAKISNYILNKLGNTVYVDQHVDRERKEFFMRLECEFGHEGFGLEQFQETLQQDLAIELNMHIEVYDSKKQPKMAVFVSKFDHCLYDILSRHQSGELGVEIPLIISNHENLEHIGEKFSIPYYHIPVTKDTKATAEAAQIKLLDAHDVDFMVLARYMQVLSPEFVAKYPGKIINIHHSFLPAFPGAKPYHSAYRRGVKIIGATSHYVTDDLDEGPIIEQEITRVSHIHDVQDFILKGRDLEKIVLSRAIKAHIARKVLVYDNRTVVFS